MSSYRRRKRPAENELSELEKLIAETEEQYEVYVPLDKRKELEAKERRRRLALSRGEAIEESDDEDSTAVIESNVSSQEQFGLSRFAPAASTSANTQDSSLPVANSAAPSAAAGAGASTPQGPSAARSTEAAGPIAPQQSNIQKDTPEGEEELSLVELARRELSRRGGGALKSEAEKNAEAEAQLLKQILLAKQSSLRSASEHASGVHYTEPLTTDWRPPRHYRGVPEATIERSRGKRGIAVEGDNAVPPHARFEDMKLPAPILAALDAKGIETPTPIQCQGMPIALTGRDMVGIAFTGSGKTLVFVLPAVLWALQEELRLPLRTGDGPIAIMLSPSRELARQTYDNVEHFSEYLAAAGYPRLRCMLAIGGESMRTQMDAARNGVHLVVATPGRLLDHLRKQRINLDLCKYLALDEGDRLLDMGFDEDVHGIVSFFKKQRQTVIFSATMPQRVQFFARSSLVKPVIVNVGSAGAANLDVLQEVQYVRDEGKMLELLKCLGKTAPPVVIFGGSQGDVDSITEYLLIKGVAATGIHGGKEQEERNEAISQFRDGTMDVLVANDVAAKGLDFPAIQHVINYDMPNELESYVHRIGRTGRRGRTGVATTFVNRETPQEVLLDLKHLLMQARQVLPPFLKALPDPDEETFMARADGTVPKLCEYCGGFHRLQSCRKMQRDARAMSAAKRDFLGGQG